MTKSGPEQWEDDGVRGDLGRLRRGHQGLHQGGKGILRDDSKENAF